MAMVQSSSDTDAVYYILQVLCHVFNNGQAQVTSRKDTQWYTSGKNIFDTFANMGYVQSDSLGGSTEGKVWCLQLPCWHVYPVTQKVSTNKITD